jgi:predicted nucleic acid-binding protein
MIAVDTNVLLRLLVRDDEGRTAAAADFLRRSAGETVLIPDLVLAEVVWTLLRLYRYSRGESAGAIRYLAGLADVEFESRDRVERALQALDSGGDFVDALLVDIARSNGASKLASFDTGLARGFPGFVVRP